MSSGDALREVCIFGIATLTMLVSSTDMNMPTISTASGTIQELSVCPFGGAVVVGGAACSGGAAAVGDALVGCAESGRGDDSGSTSVTAPVEPFPGVVAAVTHPTVSTTI